MKNVSRVLLFVACAGLIATFGQNCSKADFDTASTSTAGAAGKGAPVEMGQSEDHRQNESAPNGPPPTATPPVAGSQPPTPPSTPPPTPSTPPQAPAAILSSCGDMPIKDVTLNIASFEALEGPGKKVSVPPVLKTIKLVDLVKGIPISFPKNVAPDRLRIIFEATGNSVTEVNGTVHDLRAPSAAESGLKISVASSVNELEAGKIYSIHGFRAEDMFKDNGGGCMLAPVWKDAEIK